MPVIMYDLKSPVIQELENKKVLFHIYKHPGPIHSLQQAASERGQSPDQVVRSIVFRISEDNYVMVLVSGARQVSWPALRRYLDQSRITMATKEEILKSTGYPLGAVSPFGLPIPMRILVDQKVLEQEEISLGSGIRYVAVIMKTVDFMHALGSVEVGQFAGEEKKK